MGTVRSWRRCRGIAESRAMVAAGEQIQKMMLVEEFSIEGTYSDNVSRLLKFTNHAAYITYYLAPCISTFSTCK